MLLHFLTGNTLLIDSVSNFNEKFALFLLCNNVLLIAFMLQLDRFIISSWC